LGYFSVKKRHPEMTPTLLEEREKLEDLPNLDLNPYPHRPCLSILGTLELVDRDIKLRAGGVSSD
jgi:hypothetical protein